MTKTVEKIDQRVAFMVRPSTYRKLIALARKGDRSLSAEVRRAVEKHVARVRNDG